MFYKVNWIENGAQTFLNVYKAKDLNTITKSIRYMNWERQEEGRPLMTKIQITTIKEYDGEYIDLPDYYVPKFCDDTIIKNKDYEIGKINKRTIY